MEHYYTLCLNGPGENTFIGAFSAVNESTWEHLKLLFYPMLITTITGYFLIGKTVNNYICARTKGILIGLCFIIIFFYTYTGVLGMNVDIINVINFFVGVFIAEHTSYKCMINKNCKCNQIQCFIILGILLLCMIIFTYKPLFIGLFKDPITNTYGIYNLIKP